MVREFNNENVTSLLKMKFRQAVREYLDDEIKHLWADFVGDTPELDKKGWQGGFLPGADLTTEVHAKKQEVEKVLAFKPIADDFIDTHVRWVEDYVADHLEYLKGLMADKVGSGVGVSRADIALQLADELSLGSDEPPALLVAIYLIKQGKKLGA